MDVDIAIEGVIAETDSAWLVKLEEPESPFEETPKEWVPKSQCEISAPDGKDLSLQAVPWNGEAYVSMPEWLAIEKGLV